MREIIHLRTSQYGDKPLTVKRVVFNQVELVGLVIGQFRHYKRIKFCIGPTREATVKNWIEHSGFHDGFLEPGCWYEISISNPLFYEYMKEQTHEG